VLDRFTKEVVEIDLFFYAIGVALDAMKKYLKHHPDSIRMYSISQGRKQVPWLEMMIDELKSETPESYNTFATWSNIKMFAIEALKDGQQAGESFKYWLKEHASRLLRTTGDAWAQKRIATALESENVQAFGAAMREITNVADAEIEAVVNAQNPARQLH
jgi:hypothetical protein